MRNCPSETRVLWAFFFFFFIWIYDGGCCCSLVIWQPSLKVFPKDTPLNGKLLGNEQRGILPRIKNYVSSACAHLLRFLLVIARKCRHSLSTGVLYERQVPCAFWIIETLNRKGHGERCFSIFPSVYLFPPALVLRSAGHSFSSEYTKRNLFLTWAPTWRTLEIQHKITPKSPLSWDWGRTVKVNPMPRITTTTEVKWGRKWTDGRMRSKWGHLLSVPDFPLLPMTTRTELMQGKRIDVQVLDPFHSAPVWTIAIVGRCCSDHRLSLSNWDANCSTIHRRCRQNHRNHVGLMLSAFLPYWRGCFCPVSNDFDSDRSVASSQKRMVELLPLLR